MGYSRKKPKQGGEGVDDIEFPGVLKKEHVEIPGVYQKKGGIFKEDDQEKVFWNFHRVLVFWCWNFQGMSHSFCGISMGEPLFSPEFQRVK